MQVVERVDDVGAVEIVPHAGAVVVVRVIVVDNGSVGCPQLTSAALVAAVVLVRVVVERDFVVHNQDAAARIAAVPHFEVVVQEVELHERRAGESDADAIVLTDFVVQDAPAGGVLCLSILWAPG